jgi:hypothetical protein
MKHKIGPQGDVVPFGYVTLADGRVMQQGQILSPGDIIVELLGDSEVDPERCTAKLAEKLGVKSSSKAGE